MRGFLLIDKEKGCSSFDVVRDVRRLTAVKRVGHAGTLDPLATGLLLVAVGEGTKLLEFFIGCGKEYEVVARFGAVSDTYDAEGEIKEMDKSDLFEKEDKMRGVLEDYIGKEFLGEIEQIPPKYSALKIEGKRACDILRKGGDVEMKSRQVRIDEFEVVDFNWPEVSFRVVCGSGTYIRSLIHDLGQVVGCGAYVLELRRTKVGDFDVGDASLLGNLKLGGDEVDKKVEQGLISLEEVVEKFDCWNLIDEDFEGLKDGKALLSKKIEQDGVVMAIYKGKLVGVLENASKGGVKYRKMIF